MRLSLTFWLLVLAIPILFLGYWLLVPKVGHGNPRPTAARADIHGGIKSALDAFKVDIGSYPKGSNGLVELVQQPIGATNWHGPYFDPPKWPVDPWGNPYFYECPGRHNTNGYDLFSAGPDGKTGTGDDIGNWVN